MPAGRSLLSALVLASVTQAWKAWSMATSQVCPWWLSGFLDTRHLEQCLKLAIFSQTCTFSCACWCARFGSHGWATQAFGKTLWKLAPAQRADAAARRRLLTHRSPASQIITNNIVSKYGTCPRGPMDKASAHGAGDCRFESCRGHQLEQ